MAAQGDAPVKEEMVLVGRYRTEDFFSVQNVLVDVLGKENVSLEPSRFRDVVVFVRRDCLPTASPLLRPDRRARQSAASQESPSICLSPTSEQFESALGGFKNSQERVKALAKAVGKESLTAYSSAFFSARNPEIANALEAVEKELLRIANSLMPEKSP